MPIFVPELFTQSPPVMAAIIGGIDFIFGIAIFFLARRYKRASQPRFSDTAYALTWLSFTVAISGLLSLILSYPEAYVHISSPSGVPGPTMPTRPANFITEASLLSYAGFFFSLSFFYLRNKYYRELSVRIYDPVLGKGAGITNHAAGAAQTAFIGFILLAAFIWVFIVELADFY